MSSSNMPTTPTRSASVSVKAGSHANDTCARSLALDSLGDIFKIIYLGFEKLQRSVTHDFLRYINILTYLLTLTRSASVSVKAFLHRRH